MSIEAIGALAGVPVAGPIGGAGGVRSLDLLPRGGGAEGGAEKFQMALTRASEAAGGGGTSLSPAVENMLNVLDRVDMQAQSVSDYATEVEKSGGTLTPGEMINLTMRCQEFMFQCQLTSNIANRSSDGVQQLFRQQG